MSPDEPVLLRRREEGRELPLLLWRFARPLLGVSSGPLGGGIGRRGWVINATVPMSYRRDDPDNHLRELADQLDLVGPGVGLLTGVDVGEVRQAAEAGVRVWATVGLGSPLWAAAPQEAEAAPAERVGTVNIVVRVPVRLSDAALVNAVATVTEAKTQALWEAGVAGTGTATDSVTVLCPTDGPIAAYGGPRSTWGARIARATHAAVRAGSRPGRDTRPD